MTLSMRIAAVVPCTEAEGPGRRFALWFQGCPLRCPGCCNPEYLPFSGGQERSFAEIADAITDAHNDSLIEGITLLGGEPFAHAPAAAALAEHAQARGLSVMVFTGYLLEDLQVNPDPAVQALLARTDLLIDGPYLREHPDHARRWIGSTNQRIHCLSSRYCADDPCWKQPNTLEIRMDRQGIMINGFPASGAIGLWKGWKRKN